MKYYRADGTPCSEAEATVNGVIKDGYRFDGGIKFRDGAPRPIADGATRMSFTTGATIIDSKTPISGHINDQQFLDAKKRMDDAHQGMIDRMDRNHPDNAPRADTPPTVRDSLGTMPSMNGRMMIGDAPGQISVQDAKKAEEDAYARMVAGLNER